MGRKRKFISRKTLVGDFFPSQIIGGLALTNSVENALVDKYVELIVASHDESCPWRQRGCDGVLNVLFSRAQY